MSGCATDSTSSQGRVIRFFSRFIGWVIDLLYFRRINIRKFSFHSRAVLLGTILGLLIRSITLQLEDPGVVATLATAAAYITFVLYEELLEKAVYFEINEKFLPQCVSSRIVRRNSLGCVGPADNRTLSRSSTQLSNKDN
jgi:hypothetical protein